MYESVIIVSGKHYEEANCIIQNNSFYYDS